MLSGAHLCAGTTEFMEAMLQAGRYVYYEDLKELNCSSPKSQQPLPPGLCQIHTPLVVEQWSAQLQQHPDRDYCHYLVTGITNGFRIGFRYDTHTCRAAKRNMLSAAENPEAVEKYLQKECQLGRVVGPLAAGSVPLHINRFGVIPKSHQPDKWRLIVDLSYPQDNMA